MVSGELGEGSSSQCLHCTQAVTSNRHARSDPLEWEEISLLWLRNRKRGMLVGWDLADIASNATARVPVATLRLCRAGAS